MTSQTTEPLWPGLPYSQWRDTCTTLHLWTQVVGKVRLAQTPWLNHSWQAPLYVSPRGLSTGPIAHGRRSFDIEFDFVDALLRIRTDGPQSTIALRPMTVADFHGQVMQTLTDLGVAVTIHGSPNEMPEAVPFKDDHAPRAYDAGQARTFGQVLMQVDRVLKTFRTAFIGKASPVHFFWGSFDMAVTRFSGRRAPSHPGGVPHLPDAVAREAYSHEVSSAGFWPGGPGDQDAAFYAYAYPEPPGFREAAVAPAEARFDQGLGEFVLPYQAMRTAADPEAALLGFLQSTYAAAADAAHWDRGALECDLGVPGRPRPV